MAEYIKKSAVLKELDDCPRLKLGHYMIDGEFIDTYDVAKAFVKTEKMDRKENVVDIVRCADCREYKDWNDGKICMRLGSYYGNTNPNDYCSRGCRK